METFKLKESLLKAIQFTNTPENRKEMLSLLTTLFIDIREPENTEYRPEFYGELWFYLKPEHKLINKPTCVYYMDYIIKIKDNHFIKMSKLEMETLFIKTN